MPVVIGARPEGNKELTGFRTGVRESVRISRELLVDRKHRGLTVAPEIAVGDGATGFWQALDAAFPGARHQRCRVHMAADILGKVHGSVQPDMKADLRKARDAPDRATACAVLTVLAERYGARYPKAVA